MLEWNFNFLESLQLHLHELCNNVMSSGEISSNRLNINTVSAKRLHNSALTSPTLFVSQCCSYQWKIFKQVKFQYSKKLALLTILKIKSLCQRVVVCVRCSFFSNICFVEKNFKQALFQYSKHTMLHL